NSGEEIDLSGSRKAETLSLKEMVDTLVTGHFEGRISADLSVIEGTWSNASKSKSYPFRLQSFLPPGSAEVSSLRKHFSYEWRKNKSGESLGCEADYTYCYIMNMNEKVAEVKINESLLDATPAGNYTEDDLKHMVASAMEDEFDTYVESYQEAFPDSIAEENR